MSARRKCWAIGLSLATAATLAGCSSATGASAHAPAMQALTTVPGAGGAGGVAKSAAGVPSAIGGSTANPANNLSVAKLGQSVSAPAPLVVRTGAVTLGVKGPSIVSAFDKISALAIVLGGFVQSSSNGTVPPPTPEPGPIVQQKGTASAEPTTAQLTIRVPTNQFATLTTKVERLGHVRFQDIRGRDVTGESINLRARITNLQSEENALRALMARTGSIPDILQVQNELFGVQGDIEALSAQEGSLINSTTYGTLSVTLDAIVVARHAKPTKKAHVIALVRALRLAGHNTLVALRAVALAIGWSFPILLLLAAAGLAWLIRRRGRQGRPAVSAGATGGSAG